MEIAVLWFLEIFTTICYKLVCDRLLTKKTAGVIKQAAVWGAYFVLCNGITYYAKMPTVINSLVFIISFFVVLQLLYESGVQQKLLVVIVIWFMGCVAEVMSYLLVKSFIYGETDTLIVLIISKLLWFAGAQALVMVCRERCDVEVSAADWGMTLLIPVFSAVIAFSLSEYACRYAKELRFLSMGLLLGINLLAFLLYGHIQKNVVRRAGMDALEKLMRQYADMNWEMSAYYEELRHFKHDMKQRYLLEQTFLEQKEYDRLAAEYQESIKILGQEKLPAKTENPYVDNLINYKVLAARKAQIQIETSLSVAKDAVFLETDLYCLLGNLLDNAIEAAAKTEEKQIFLRMKLWQGNLLIELENSCITGSTVDDVRAGNIRGILKTTKTDTKNHGMGLSIIRNIVEKYHGEMQLQEKESRFLARVWLFDVETTK